MSFLKCFLLRWATIAGAAARIKAAKAFVCRGVLFAGNHRAWSIPRPVSMQSGFRTISCNRAKATHCKPSQNGINESFHSRLRDECLDLELFYGLREARWTIEGYRQYFNEQRLHGALGYVPPVEFKHRWRAEHPTNSGALPRAPGI